MYSGPDGIEGEFQDHGCQFCDGRHEEREDELDVLVVVPLVDNGIGIVEEVLIDVYVDGSGDKRVREGQSHSPVEFPAFFFD